MKLYINTKKMIFDEDNIEHEIVLAVSDLEFYGYDLIINLKDDDKFIRDTLKIKYEKDIEGNNIIRDRQFKVMAEGWSSHPLYEIVNKKIISFGHTKFEYFNNTDRRIALAFRINDLYNPSSEAKILRKTLKYIMGILNVEYPDFFKKYDNKIEAIINKNPKGR